MIGTLALCALLGAGSVWTAEDRLGPGLPALPGSWWAGVSLTEREAVAGELEVRLRIIRETGRGVGLAVARGWILSDRDDGALETGLRGLWRRSGWRLSAGVSQWTWGEHRRLSIPLAVKRSLNQQVLVGALAEYFPGEPPGAHRFTGSLAVMLAPWMGRLQLGPEARGWETAIALQTTSPVDWVLTYSDGTPGFGVDVDLGALELRTRSMAHARLGAVHEVSVVVTGGAS